MKKLAIFSLFLLSMSAYSSSQDVCKSFTTALDSYGKTNSFVATTAHHFYSITNRSGKPGLYILYFQNCPDVTGCSQDNLNLTINNGETVSGDVWSNTSYLYPKAGTHNFLARTTVCGQVTESTAHIIISG